VLAIGQLLAALANFFVAHPQKHKNMALMEG
jgi:hypothetical protein